MKITKANIWHGESGGIRPVILELVAEDGTTGIGEAGVAYGVGARAAVGMLHDIIERYMMGGVDAFAAMKLWQEIYDHGFWAKGGGPVVFSAVSAIEQAMLDIKARMLNVPVYELLGGRVQDSLRTYCNGWYFGATSDSDLPAFAARAVADGYTALKFYPFVTILPEGKLRHPSMRGASDPTITRRALKNIAAIRQAIGPDVELMLDLSAGLTVDDTIHFCRAAEEYGITYMEEPAVPGDTAALTKIAAGIPQRLAVGERLYTRYAFRDVLESRSVDILQPDIQNTGGLFEARQIAAMAEAYGIKVQPHICASAVSTAVGMHFSASVPNFYIQEHFPYWARIPGHVDFVENPVEETVRDGAIPVNDQPGFGISLRHKAIDHWGRRSFDLL